LLKERRDVPASEIENNTEYSKAPKNQRQSLIRSDLTNLLEELGIRTFKIKHYKNEPGRTSYADDVRALLKIRGRPFVFRLAVRPGFSSHVPHRTQAERCWQFEHGILFLPLENPTKSAFYRPLVHYKEPWGFFTVYYAKAHSFLKSPTPSDKETDIPVPTLTSLRTTDRLRNSFTQFLEFVEWNDIAFDQLNSARKATNKLLKYWEQSHPQDFNDWHRGAAAEMAKQARAVLSILSS
jgi:hypothetical protein